MVTKEFLEFLSQKLKTGNLSSIHLNALVQNYVARFDLQILENFSKDEEGKTIFNIYDDKANLASEFTDLLFNKPNFKFTISLHKLFNSCRDENQIKKLQSIIKRFDSIFYQSLDDRLESGLNSFGFGFPLIIKREKENPAKVIKAPLLIWKLNIEKSKTQPYTWIISKEEEFPIGFNELLISQIANDEGIVLKSIPGEFLEDNIIQKEELVALCNTVLSQINFAKSEINIDFELEKCPARKKLEEQAKNEAFVQFSGIFGIYKSQKQSIIKDIEELTTSFDEFDFKPKVDLNFEANISAVDTDPSQEYIINHFSESEIKLIQGPPGTGKSQTISAIVTNALANKAKCLIICEKKTPLEVIFKNLDKLGIGTQCAVIDDINKDRAKVIDLARSKMQLSSRKEQSSTYYKNALMRYETKKEDINKKLDVLHNRFFADYNFKDVVGIILKNREIANAEKLHKQLNAIDYIFDYENFTNYLELFKKGFELFNLAKAKKSGLNYFHEFVFQQEKLGYKKDEYLIELKELFEITSVLDSYNKAYSEKTSEFYNKKSGWTNFISVPASIFSKKIKEIRKLRKNIFRTFIKLESKYLDVSSYNFELPNYDSFEDYSKLYASIADFNFKLSKTISDFSYFDRFNKWKNFFDRLIKKEQAVLGYLCEYPEGERFAAYKIWFLDNVLNLYIEQNDIELDTDQLEKFWNDREKLQKGQIGQIQEYWNGKQKESLLKYKGQSSSLKRLYNYRKNKEFGRKNALRKIIAYDFELFTDFFPVVLTNPNVCSSLFPLTPGLFDIVIFDEAGQLRIEDTFSALLRGKFKVISGDKHQMPPSNYFQSGPVISMGFEDEEAIYLAESESLLEYAQEDTFEQTYLDFHYRSQHPHLIDFSNAAFYGNRLVPMPSTKDYKAIRMINVNGIYENGVNEEEALRVVEILKNSIHESRNDVIPSVGVATLNIYQRNLIWEKIREESYENRAFAHKLSLLNSKGFFVKNLENLQGDERDIIILSTTFGIDPEGNFRRNFGPLNQEKGYRLLNVLVTRAKHSLYVCTSIPQSDYAGFSQLIGEKGNNGRGIFYAYLAYAESIETGNEHARQNVLNLLLANCNEVSHGNLRNVYSSPFEDSLKSILLKNNPKSKVEINYPFGGFTIDLLVTSENEDTEKTAMEADGHIHSSTSESYLYQLYRKKLLESRGIKYLPVWSKEIWEKK